MAKTNIPVDSFQYLAKEMKQKLLTDNDSEQFDRTNLFWEVLKDKCDSGELNNIGVVGEVRKGKSTIAIYIAWWLNNYLDQKHDRPETDIAKHIFSDQTEFLRFIKSQTMHVAVAIDEFNFLADTGLNATTESALFDYYSAVFAGMYVHRIACSPSTLVDKNTTVILHVLGKNETEKITRCRLSYRDPVDRSVTILGHVDIYVGDLIDDPFYKKYLRKKYLRMQLVSSAGIRDIRELEFGLVTTGVWQELAEIATSMNINRDLVSGFVNDWLRRNGMIYSELAKMEVTNRLAGIVSLIKEIRRLNNTRPKSPEQDATLRQNKKVIATIFTRRVEEEQRLATVYDQYLAVTGDEPTDTISIGNMQEAQQWQHARNATKPSTLPTRQTNETHSGSSANTLSRARPNDTKERQKK